MSTEEYKDMFVEESREHLNTINQSLLDFEKNPEDKEAMNKIFRAAHTIKGMSATLNYDKIQKLSHKTEDTLDLIRNHKLDVDSEVIDLIFDCFDGIEKMIDDIANSNSTDYDIEGIIDRLEKQTNDDLKNLKDSKPQPIKKNKAENLDEIKIDKKFEKAIIKEINNGKNAYRLDVSVDQKCAMKSIRSFLLLKKLSEAGNVIYSKPDKNAIEDGNFEDGFELYYISEESIDDIQKIVDSVAELTKKNVSPIEIEDKSLKITSKIADDKQENPDLKEKQQEKQVEGKFEKKDKGTIKQDEKQKSSESRQQSIRIGMDQLDTFMNLIGELVISKGRLSQIALDNRLDDLTETINTFDRLTTELQEKIMTIRMIPMKHIFDRFPRMVRDLAKNKGKKIDLRVEGEGIELDRTVLDEIGDPLVHLLRNSVDHGIENPETRLKNGKAEQGIVELIAERKRNHVLIVVKDDGAGIDPNVMRKAAVDKGLRTPEEVDSLSNKEALDLLWLPGLSTAKEISDVSGRGVGMDVVKSTIEKLNGAVEMSSQLGVGTTFSLRLPLTMAIFKALFVGVCKEIYAIPISNVIETISMKPEEITVVRGGMTTVLRNKILPLISLSSTLGIASIENTRKNDTIKAVVIQKEDKQFGLIVDKLVGEQEITIKNIRGSLKKTKGIAGVTITGDGSVILVIDINTLLE